MRAPQRQREGPPVKREARIGGKAFSFPSHPLLLRPPTVPLLPAFTRRPSTPGRTASVKLVGPSRVWPRRSPAPLPPYRPPCTASRGLSGENTLAGNVTVLDAISASIASAMEKERKPVVHSACAARIKALVAIRTGDVEKDFSLLVFFYCNQFAMICKRSEDRVASSTPKGKAHDTQRRIVR